jgi:hypothetical protein
MQNSSIPTARRRTTTVGHGTLRQTPALVDDITRRLSDFGNAQNPPFTVQKIEERQNSVYYSVSGAHFTFDLITALSAEFPGVEYDGNRATIEVPISPEIRPASAGAKAEAGVMVAAGLVLVACATALSWAG